MKKLMIAMVAMAVGLAANAATCKWSGLMVAPKASDDDVTKYVILLLDSSVTDATTMAGYLKKGDTSYLSAATIKTTAGIKAGTNMRWSEAGFGDYTIGDTFTYYSVVLNSTDNTIASATDYMITSELVDKKVTSNAGLDMSFGNQSSNTWVKMEGGSGPVPEPTSGMLLMFGLATLALRRRRA